ncbi:M28 family peptidase [Methylobacter sp. BBA5.1]|uniref:M28 family peptidase n=1 Tax=Methylobacter sp. BBA5.1 TaxID=1495064 RepID=UPI000561BF09|nr:M28 family peptidase [Methylobacter sp. BBA5.1]
MAEISVERLKTHVYKLAGEIGQRNIFHPQALDAAAHYITEEWHKQGYEVRSHVYKDRGVERANLEITCEGKNRNREYILVGAHYDSVIGSPGANDNGSGIAALLELSRLFSGLKPNVSLRFVAFVNEEPPFFYSEEMGSMIYAKAAKQRREPIRFMIALETIACYRNDPGSQAYPPMLKYFYPDTGNFIAFVANLRSRGVMLESARAFSASTDFPLQMIAAPDIVPGVSWSDHSSFWRHGYKAFMVTDTALYRYPYYHAPEDTPDQLDYEPFARMTQGLFLMLASLTG